MWWLICFLPLALLSALVVLAACVRSGQVRPFEEF